MLRPQIWPGLVFSPLELWVRDGFYRLHVVYALLGAHSGFILEAWHVTTRATVPQRD